MGLTMLFSRVRGTCNIPDRVAAQLGRLVTLAQQLRENSKQEKASLERGGSNVDRSMLDFWVYRSHRQATTWSAQPELPRRSTRSSRRSTASPSELNTRPSLFGTSVGNPAQEA
jgi:hypothetical protein